MIILLLLDIILYNTSPFKPFFFLIYLPFITKKNIVTLIITALVLDLFIFDAFPINLVILIALYYLNRFIFKRNTFLLFMILCVINYLIYTFAIYLIFNYQRIEILYYLRFILESGWINIIFYILGYNLLFKNIKFNG